MPVWIKHLTLAFTWIKPLQPMLLQCPHQYCFRHLESIIQICEIFVILIFLGRGVGIAILGSKLGGRDGSKGAVKVIHAFDKVGGELCNGEVAGGLDITFRPVLEIAKVGNGAKVAVLERMSIAVPVEAYSGANFEIDDLSIFSFKLFFYRVCFLCSF